MRDAHAELENWGRWARTWREPLDVAEPPLFAAYIPNKDYDPGHAESDPEEAGGKADDFQAAIDERGALETDIIMFVLHQQDAAAFFVLHARFYLGERMARMTVDEAVRVFTDIDARSERA